MRAYFDKLLTPNPQQKQLPLIYPSLIAFIFRGCLCFALAPYHYWWLALIPCTALYHFLRRRSAKQAFWYWLGYGFGLWFVGRFWLYTSIHVYGDTNSACVSV